MTATNGNLVVVILYTNYRGETSHRRIIPRGVRFASSEWHPGEQWLLDALDVDKMAERSFALKDVREWSTPDFESPDVSSRPATEGSTARNGRAAEYRSTAVQR